MIVSDLVQIYKYSTTDLPGSKLFGTNMNFVNTMHNIEFTNTYAAFRTLSHLRLVFNDRMSKRGDSIYFKGLYSVEDLIVKQ